MTLPSYTSSLHHHHARQYYSPRRSIRPGHPFVHHHHGWHHHPPAPIPMSAAAMHSHHQSHIRNNVPLPPPPPMQSIHENQYHRDPVHCYRPADRYTYELLPAGQSVHPATQPPSTLGTAQSFNGHSRCSYPPPPQAVLSPTQIQSDGMTPDVIMSKQLPLSTVHPNQLPSSGSSQQPSHSVSKKTSKKMFNEMLKSPITTCFERMLGAADLIDRKPDFEGPPTDELENLATQATGASKRKSNYTKKSNVPPKKRKSVPEEDDNDDDLLVDGQQPPLLNEEMTDDNPFDQITEDPELYRRVLLEMAVQRSAYEEKPPCQSTSPPEVVSDGFFWRDIPFCEQILYDHMPEYYGIASVRKRCKEQYSFNNMLVTQVRQIAAGRGVSFHPDLNDKKLRDRIRCFYKTHLQNAKKRLVTLQKNKTSEDHQAMLRVYIRCVKMKIPFEQSLCMEPPVKFIKPGRVSQIEKAKHFVACPNLLDASSLLAQTEKSLSPNAVHSS